MGGLFPFNSTIPMKGEAMTYYIRRNNEIVTSFKNLQFAKQFIRSNGGEVVYKHGGEVVHAPYDWNTENA